MDRIRFVFQFTGKAVIYVYLKVYRRTVKAGVAEKTDLTGFALGEYRGTGNTGNNCDNRKDSLLHTLVGLVKTQIKEIVAYI
jgi:hypothetical protein